MNFQVPQFIEIEDKVFGPLSFKQFIYAAGSVGLAFLLYVFLPLPLLLKLIPIGIILGLGFALAFYKINNRPFIIVLQSALRYTLNSKLYLWEHRRKNSNTNIGQTTLQTTPTTVPPKLSKSKLADLSWSLDVKETLQ